MYQSAEYTAGRKCDMNNIGTFKYGILIQAFCGSTLVWWFF